jgi:tetratricopeptide (TPR) repeat protein
MTDDRHDKSGPAAPPASPPEDTHKIYDMGQKLMDARCPVEAGKWFREALRLDPEHSQAANGLGDSCFDLGEHEEAATWYRRAVAIRRAFPEAWLNLAIVLMEQNRWEEAAKALQETIALEPEFDEAYLYLAQCQLHQNRPADAKPLLQEAIAREPAEFQSYLALSDCCLRLGDLEGAIAACEAALDHMIGLEELHLLIESLKLAGLSPDRADRLQRRMTTAQSEGRVITEKPDRKTKSQSRQGIRSKESSSAKPSKKEE